MEIAHPQISAILREQLLALCEHQYEMARTGCKWSHKQRFYGAKPSGGKLELFHNPIYPSTITLLIENPALHGVFTVFDDPNFMYMSDPSLYTYTLEWMTKLRSKCTRISEDGEQFRRAFFNDLKRKIQEL